MNDLRYRNYLLLFLLSAVWSLLLFHYWSYDYGVYYNQAVNLSDDFRLYSGVFDTKGPLYFLFINKLSKIIGVGIIQSYLTLCITVCLFFTSIYYIASTKTKKNFFLLFFFFISMLHQQNVNISLPLFQFAIQILSFFFLMESFERKHLKNFNISCFLFILSFFTKIDVIVYLPVYLLRIFFFKDIKIKAYSIILFLVQILLIFLFLSYALDFSLEDFWWHNYIFNSNASAGAWFREPFLKIFNSPFHIYVLMFTGVMVIFVEIFNEVLKKQKINFLNIFKQNSSTIKFIFQILIILMGGFIWLWSGTDKNYHVLMITLPLIFFISYNFQALDKSSFKIIFFYLLTFFFFLITLYPDTKNVITNKCWKKQIYCNQINQYSGLIEDLKKHKSDDRDIFVIGSYAGWEYLLSDKKIHKSVTHYMLYVDILHDGKRIELEMPQYLIDDYNELIKKNKGFVFWIETDLVNSVNTKKKGLVASKKLLQLLSISKQTENLGKYYRYEIR
tara:strand:- start:240 stop:1748 length:1509 start_codon:yes stop_codon:yes gene_type:complete